MIPIAIPAHIPRARRHLTPTRRTPLRWPWPGWTRRMLAVSEDGVARSRRLQMDQMDQMDRMDGTETWGPAGAAGGEPGPAQVVDALFQAHARAVLAYLVHRLPTPLDAEDALDDVFLAALNACASGQTLTGGWLMVTAQRRIADFYRRRQRAPWLDATLDSTDAASERHAGESSEPEWVTLRDEEHRELRRLVARLPHDQREVLALRFAAGMRSPEIGEVVGKHADAVRALLARAMRRLREEWTR